MRYSTFCILTRVIFLKVNKLNQMANDELETGLNDDQEVIWSSRQRERNNSERRAAPDRRQMAGRAINVPDMRAGNDRRSGADRRKVKLTITGRAMDA
jgi:hypothetical protein